MESSKSEITLKNKLKITEKQIYREHLNSLYASTLECTKSARGSEVCYSLRSKARKLQHLRIRVHVAVVVR